MSAVTSCARPGCSEPLTPRQIARGTRYHSKRCAAQLRRLAPPSTRTHCRVCPRRLTPQQITQRNDHCSIRCAQRTRFGRPAHTRTTCADCEGPLTRRQIWRRRDYCNKSCARAACWRQHPEYRQQATARSHAAHRRAFIARLRTFLLTHTPAEAGAKGWRNGWAVGRHRARRRGLALPRAPYGLAVTTTQAIVAAAPSAAEAYRRCYAAAYRCAWPTSTPAAAAQAA